MFRFVVLSFIIIILVIDFMIALNNMSHRQKGEYPIIETLIRILMIFAFIYVVKWF